MPDHLQSQRHHPLAGDALADVRRGEFREFSVERGHEVVAPAADIETNGVPTILLLRGRHEDHVSLEFPDLEWEPDLLDDGSDGFEAIPWARNLAVWFFIMNRVETLISAISRRDSESTWPRLLMA